MLYRGAKNRVLKNLILRELSDLREYNYLFNF